MKIILKYFFLPILSSFLFNLPYATAQKQGQEKLDSLFLVLKSDKTDTNKVNTLNALAKEFRTSNSDTASFFAKEAIEVSNKIKYKQGTGNAYFEIGTIFYNKGNFSEALKNHISSLKIREEIGEEKNIADSYYNIGLIYWQQSDFIKALLNENNALKIYETIINKKGMAHCYHVIGMIYSFQSNYSEALRNYSKAFQYYNEIDDKEGAANISNNAGVVNWKLGKYSIAIKNYFNSLMIYEKLGSEIGISASYRNIGSIYEDQGNLTEALKNYQAALQISKKINDKKGIVIAYMSIGIIYRKQKNYSESLKNYFEGLKISIEIEDKIDMADLYGNIGNVYCQRGNYSEAIVNILKCIKIEEEIGNKDGISGGYSNLGIAFSRKGQYSEGILYFNKALNIANEIGQKSIVKETYESLSETYEKMKDFNNALKYHKLFTEIKDTLLNEDNDKQIAQIKIQYESDKKDKEIELLSKDKQIQLKEISKQKLVRNSFIGGFAVVLLFAGVFFTQRNKISKGKKLSDELLLNILPSEVAEELKLNGSAVAKQFDDVTVIFTDFKDFTKISEKLSPSELVAEIDTCFKAFDNIMEKYHIEKIKTIGDSYMAAGGLPVPNKTNATDVVNAALEIHKFMIDHAQQKLKNNEESFEIRIGIHTGPVVAGIVGIKKYSYDIWGDTVNIASRMESSGEAGRINISGSTYELVKDKFNCIHRGKIEAKNKGEIDMYFVLSPNQLAS